MQLEHHVGRDLAKRVEPTMRWAMLWPTLRIQRSVRGVTFQPTQAAGRLNNFDPETDSFSLTEVRQGIIAQSPVFKAADLLPVPCNPDVLAMAAC
jgi:uncharacterized radical SAM superfamily Fe-S cluster-containing enzyme